MTTEQQKRRDLVKPKFRLCTCVMKSRRPYLDVLLFCAACHVMCWLGSPSQHCAFPSVGTSGAVLPARRRASEGDQRACAAAPSSPAPPGPCVAVPQPAGSGCVLPAQAVSGRLHQACQALSRQRLALEGQLKQSITNLKSAFCFTDFFYSEISICILFYLFFYIFE